LSLTLTIGNLDKVLAELKAAPKDIDRIINNEFKAFGQDMENKAKLNAPVNEGKLRQSISHATTNLAVKVAVNVDYAAFVEFGTKKFAAEWVATLPPDWQAFAATFKGKGGGNFTQLFYRILQWVTIKGVAATHSVKTKKRINSKANQQTEREVAYAITLSILKNGIHAQPYFYPAFNETKIDLIKNLKKQLNAQ